MQRTISLAAAKSSSSTSVLSLRPLMAKRLGIVLQLGSLSLPNFRRAWNYLGFCTFCSTNKGNFFTEEFKVGSQVLQLQTGKIACFADGSAMIGMDDTQVLATVCTTEGTANLRFRYYENQYAQGFIPNPNVYREEISRKEALIGHLCRKAIKPLIFRGFHKKIEIMANLLSLDGKQDPTILVANATSAALMLSSVPWGGPVGFIRIGMICGQVIVNPTMDELSATDMNLIYACTRDKTMIIDLQASEISEKDLAAALRIAHGEAVKYLDPQIRLAEKAGKQKYNKFIYTEKVLEEVTYLAASRIKSIVTNSSYDKVDRQVIIKQELQKILGNKASPDLFYHAAVEVSKEVYCSRSLVDRKHLGSMDSYWQHGSTVFKRGIAQVSCRINYGPKFQILDSLFGPQKRRLIAYYSLPPHDTCKEVIHAFGLEVSSIVETALLAVMPPQESFSSTVSIISEVKEQWLLASTCMAIVCGGSMAMMNDGIPLRAHVAAISVGYFTDRSSGDIEYHIIMDSGLEEHFKHMEMRLNIAGTRNGVTAAEMVKGGVPLDTICKSLENALEARVQVIEQMERDGTR